MSTLLFDGCYRVLNLPRVYFILRSSPVPTHLCCIDTAARLAARARKHDRPTTLRDREREGGRERKKQASERERRREGGREREGARQASKREKDVAGI